MTTYNISDAKLKSIIKNAVLSYVENIQDDIFSALEGYQVNSVVSDKPLKIGVSRGEDTEVIGIPSELSKMNAAQLTEYILRKGWNLPPDSEKNKKGNFLKTTLIKHIKDILKEENTRPSSRKKSRSKSKSHSRSNINDVYDVRSGDILPEEEEPFEDVTKTSKQESEGIDEIAQDEVNSYFTGEATVDQYRSYLRAAEKYGDDIDRIVRHTGIPEDIVQDIIENPVYYDNMVSKIDIPKKNYGSNLQQIKPGGKGYGKKY